MPPAASPAPPAATFLRDLAVSPATLATLLLAWVVLLLVGTQLPQLDAPMPVTDGLSRGDLLALQAFGLHRLGASVPLLLLCAATAIVGVARLLFPTPLRRTNPGMPPLDRLVPVLQELGLHPHLRGQTVRIGAPTLGPLLLVAAGALAVAAWIAQAIAPLPVWLDVPLGQPEATLPAWTVDAGSLAPAAGRWAGQCTQEKAGLRCELQIPGGRQTVRLQPGRTSQVAGRDVSWAANATGLTNLADLRLRWLVQGRPWRLQLTTGEVGEAAELGARLQPFATRTAGPLVVVQRASGLVVLTSPQVAGRQAQGRVATLQRPDVARLRFTTPTAAPWLLAIALLLGSIGAVLAWLRPALRLDREPGGLVVHRCNRAQVLQKIVEFGEGQA